ncbi:DUF4433 domain-containing protein [bacterium]|nr:DUF4433 domain-containing protein [bacterium]
MNKFEYTVPKYLYRISRITNLNSIINKGLLSRNLAKKLVCFEDNSYSNIQDRRLEFSDYNLHDYALLFFSKYSPMIYSKKVSENISDEIILIFD